MSSSFSFSEKYSSFCMKNLLTISLILQISCWCCSGDHHVPEAVAVIDKIPIFKCEMLPNFIRASQPPTFENARNVLTSTSNFQCNLLMCELYRIINKIIYFHSTMFSRWQYSDVEFEAQQLTNKQFNEIEQQLYSFFSYYHTLCSVN